MENNRATKKCIADALFHLQSYIQNLHIVNLILILLFLRISDYVLYNVKFNY